MDQCFATDEMRKVGPLKKNTKSILLSNAGISGRDGLIPVRSSALWCSVQRLQTSQQILVN